MVEALDRIPWSDTPPDTSDERYYPLIRPTAYSPVYGIVISQTIISAPTHWIDNHTKPCEGDKDHCEGCRLDYAVRWKSYAAAIIPNTGKIGILELTGEAIRHCPRIAGKGKIVRGVQLKLYRRGKYSNAPVVAEVVAEIDPGKLTVASFDVRPHLMRIWGMMPTSGMRRRRVRHDQAHAEGGDA